MVAFFAIGPFGGLLGLGLGVWLVLHRRGAHRSFAAFAGAILTAVALVAAIYGAVIGFYALTDDVLVRNGPPPQLLFELRLPAGTVLPDKLEGVSVDLDPTRTRCSLRSPAPPPMTAGRCCKASSTSISAPRAASSCCKGEPDRLFMLKLPANPPASPDFGPWQRVDSIDDKPGQEPRKAGDGHRYEARYRVKRAD